MKKNQVAYRSWKVIVNKSKKQSVIFHRICQQSEVSARKQFPHNARKNMALKLF